MHTHHKAHAGVNRHVYPKRKVHPPLVQRPIKSVGIAMAFCGLDKIQKIVQDANARRVQAAQERAAQLKAELEAAERQRRARHEGALNLIGA